MSYNKSKLRKDYKKVFNSSQRKDYEVICAEQSSLPLNYRPVWIPGKSNTSKHKNTYSNDRYTDSSSRTSTKYNDTTDNFNHNSLETNKTYTIINITANGSSKEKVPINALAKTTQVIDLDRPQKKITTKENDCHLEKSKYNTGDGSLAIKDKQDVISVTDQYTKSPDNCLLRDHIEDVTQKEKDDEFDIVFLNNQQQLEIKTINI